MWEAQLHMYINVTTFTHFDQSWNLGCLLALDGSYVDFPDSFVMLSVSAPLLHTNYITH